MTESQMRFGLFRNHPNARAYARDTPVFREGDLGDTMFAIKSGRVAIIVNGSVVDELGAGDIFGEMALLERQPRTASAVAQEDSELVEIDRTQFYLLVKQNPHFALQLLQLFSERLRRANVLYTKAAP